jgi:predicted phage terminase large subunit-like protein
MAKNLNLSAGELLAWKKARWLARFDLVYLCNEILGYVDVSHKVHGGLIRTLQQFPKPSREQFDKNDYYENGKWNYKPIFTLKEFVAQPGKRRRLILDSRGHLKTTINCQAHTIQWLLNYPDAAIHILQSNLDKGNMIVDEIRDHFRYNPKLRQLFPELCPQKSINDFGKVGQFDIRKLYDVTQMRKEPSVLAGSIDKGTAGLHFDVMKFSDIVDPNNCFGDQLEKVAKSFYMAENLLVAPSYWIDVEGTRYNFGDVYGKIIETYEKANQDGREPEYLMYVRACFERDTGNEPPKYIPEEQLLPFKKDSFGKRIPVWPERFPLQKLEEMERTDPTIFSAQQINFPIGGLDGQILFPVDPKENYPALISRKNFNENVRVSYYEISVDTAETIGGRSDYTAMSVCAWAKSGRAYIVDIFHGKILPDQIITQLFFLYKKWNKSRYAPVQNIKIEETGFVRGLNSAIGREEESQKIKLPIQFMKRDTSLSKTERILKTLQPWYVNREIRFLDDIPALEAMKRELIQFPNSPKDDILDSLADLFNGKEYFGRFESTPSPEIIKDKSMELAYGLLSPWDQDYPSDGAGNINTLSRIPW